MIHLIGEIVLYLLAALLVGATAGWLLRDWRWGRDHAAARELTPLRVPIAPARLPADVRETRLERELVAARTRTTELELQSEAHAGELAGVSRRLVHTERRMQELERERELQNRALQVLHQQLELATERRVRKPPRSADNAA